MFHFALESRMLKVSIALIFTLLDASCIESSRSVHCTLSQQETTISGNFLFEV